MIRLGTFLTIVGFLSVVLFEFTDYRLRLLMWADDYQPAIGLVAGLIGVALIVIKKATSKEQPAAAK